MIRVKRLNNKEFVVNSELILFVEATPDTVITLTTGQKIVVAESIDDIINKVIDYKARIYAVGRSYEGREV
ncbi:MAG: flagellar FlbD family protein [Tissierellia bacterium]|nr:flagellar FlbD family protein [Tissierellia bacterium]